MLLLVIWDMHELEETKGKGTVVKQCAIYDQFIYYTTCILNGLKLRICVGKVVIKKGDEAGSYASNC